VRDMFLTLEIGQSPGGDRAERGRKIHPVQPVVRVFALNAGRITLDGTDLTHAPAEARLRAGLGRTFQIPRPFPRMTLLENTLTAAQTNRAKGF